jgi:hypothetical protein
MKQLDAESSKQNCALRNNYSLELIYKSTDRHEIPMGIDIAIHAEKFVANTWVAVSTYQADFTIGGHLLETWVESRALYYERDRLSKIFREIGTASPYGPAPRGFPADVSDEVLRALPPLDADPAKAEHWRQKALNANFSQSWLRLDELLAFDWQRSLHLVYGQVLAEYATWFGDGQQPFPPELPPTAWGEPSPTRPPPIWQFWVQRTPRFTPVSWQETAAQVAGETFMNEVLPQLLTYGDRQSVRILYWRIA